MTKRRIKFHYKHVQRLKAVQFLPAWQREGLTQTVELLDDSRSKNVRYDESLFEHARTQWQFGDWNSLAQLDPDTLQHHPDHAKLALPAAAGGRHGRGTTVLEAGSGLKH